VKNAQKRSNMARIVDGEFVFMIESNSVGFDFACIFAILVVIYVCLS